MKSYSSSCRIRLPTSRGSASSWSIRRAAASRSIAAERGVDGCADAGVGRRRRLVEPALDARPLLGDDLVELLADVGEDVAQLVALLELLAPAAEPLAELVEAGQVGARRVASSASRAPSAGGAPRRGRPRP